MPKIISGLQISVRIMEVIYLCLGIWVTKKSINLIIKTFDNTNNFNDFRNSNDSSH